MASELTQRTRRYDLDWLRIIAFLLLILYHIGMFYVPWSWHVKSVHAPVDAARLPMLLMNSWRLPLLFFVSGVAVRYAMDKSHTGTFIRSRMVRLFLPLVFGMFVICAPQAYLELKASGQFAGNFLQFYKGYAAFPWASPEGWDIITPTWNHLWYLLYVLVYTLALGVISLITRKRFEALLDRVASFALRNPAVCLMVALPFVFVLVRFVLSASYGAQQTLWGDWHNLLASFMVMLFGYSTAKNPVFWEYLKAVRWFSLAAALVFSGLIALNHNNAFLSDAMRAVLRIVHCWAVIYALLGFGQLLLNKPSGLLSYLSAAIFPYYILHQTVIIVAGAALTGLGLSLPVELALVTLITLLSCIVLYHFVIRKLGSLGVLLGATGATSPTSPIGATSAEK